MKKLLILFALVAFVAIGNTQAQGFKEAPSNAETSTVLSDITIDGKTYKGGITKSGNVFYERVSKSGKTYRVYMGKDTGKTFAISGREVPVYVKNHKDGSNSYYCYYHKTTDANYPSSKQVVKE